MFALFVLAAVVAEAAVILLRAAPRSTAEAVVAEDVATSGSFKRQS